MSALFTTHEVIHPQQSEDCRVFGFRGLPSTVEWLSTEEAEQLRRVIPDDDVSDDVSHNFRHKVLDDLDAAVINHTTMLLVFVANDHNLEQASDVTIHSSYSSSVR